MTDRGSHSGDAVSGDEDVSVVDTLAVKLFCEMQEMVDKHEAARREAELWKAKKKSVSNILVPPPPPDLPLEDSPVTQQSTAVRNSLSLLTGTVPNNNNVPTLEEEMTAVVTPKMLKRQ